MLLCDKVPEEEKHEGLQHDLGHLLTIGLWVQGSLTQEDWVVLWGHLELTGGVVPDLQKKTTANEENYTNSLAA